MARPFSLLFAYAESALFLSLVAALCPMLGKAQSLCGPNVKVNFTNSDLYPSGLLSTGSQGNVYGTAGAMIWKYSPTAGFSTLASFSTLVNLNGVVPDSQGNLSGTTAWGGVNCGANSNGCGFIFELTAGGALNTVFEFSGPGARAAVGQLTVDGNGNLTGSETQSNNGTIVTGLTETGTYTVNSDCSAPPHSP